MLLLRRTSSSPLTLRSAWPFLATGGGAGSVGDASYTDFSFLRVLGRSAGIGRSPIPSNVVVEPLKRPVDKELCVLKTVILYVSKVTY